MHRRQCFVLESSDWVKTEFKCSMKRPRPWTYDLEYSLEYYKSPSKGKQEQNEIRKWHQPDLCGLQKHHCTMSWSMCTSHQPCMFNPIACKLNRCISFLIKPCMTYPGEVLKLFWIQIDWSQLISIAQLFVEPFTNLKHLPVRVITQGQLGPLSVDKYITAHQLDWFFTLAPTVDVNQKMRDEPLKRIIAGWLLEWQYGY